MLRGIKQSLVGANISNQRRVLASTGSRTRSRVGNCLKTSVDSNLVTSGNTTFQHDTEGLPLGRLSCRPGAKQVVSLSRIKSSETPILDPYLHAARRPRAACWPRVDDDHEGQPTDGVSPFLWRMNPMNVPDYRSNKSLHSVASVITSDSELILGVNSGKSNW